MPRGINRDAIRELAQLLDETELTEIEYDTGSVRIRVVRAPAPVPGPAVVAAAAPAPPSVAPAVPAETAAPAVEGPHPGSVLSPMVGTVYLAPEPGATNFVSADDTVVAGQTLMLVEAMKTFNEIKAPRAGVVREIRVENGAPVEYGDVLAIVE